MRSAVGMGSEGRGQTCSSSVWSVLMIEGGKSSKDIVMDFLCDAKRLLYSQSVSTEHSCVSDIMMHDVMSCREYVLYEDRVFFG